MRHAHGNLLCNLCFFLAISSPLLAQTEVTPFRPGVTTEGVCYFLPKTMFEVVVTAEKAVTKPGEFAAYSDRYLRQPNVPTAESTEWTIKEIALMPYGVPDSTKAFSIKLRSQTSAPLVSLTDEGLLLSINKRVEQEMVPELPKGSHARSRDYMELFGEAISYIDDHFNEGLTLEEMASRTGFSKFHFSRLFKKYTHYNFIDYLHFRRIKEAEHLLLRNDISISDVAFTAGFSSISTFNRIFRQEKGCSPSEYRYRHLPGNTMP